MKLKHLAVLSSLFGLLALAGVARAAAKGEGTVYPDHWMNEAKGQSLKVAGAHTITDKMVPDRRKGK